MKKAKREKKSKANQFNKTFINLNQLAGNAMCGQLLHLPDGPAAARILKRNEGDTI